MVDQAVVAAKIAAIEDATSRIRSVLPGSLAAFLDDRTVREVVILNLFVAIEEAIGLATSTFSRGRLCQLPAKRPKVGPSRSLA